MKHLLTIGAALALTVPAQADIIINEVMQSNVYSTVDDLNDFPDSWVELYNNGATTVDLEGWRLHTKDKYKSAYALPDVSIRAGETLLIYCDKVGEGLHTDFRIDSGKGDIYLYDAEGNIADHITLKKQPAPEVGYGRESDGSGKWGYMLTPTPGTPNQGGVTDTVLGNVTFSEAGGVRADNRTIELTLKLPKDAPAGARILFTTDGTEPTEGAANEYTVPISIDESTVVRAKAVAEGCVSRPSDVQSYIFAGREIKVPIVSIVIDESYLYDEEFGIFANGYGGDLQENWRQNWRRPLNIEIFERQGEKAVINQLGETRVHGGLSRTNKLKSMAVYANKRFGTKRFDHQLWPEDKPGVTVSKSLLLRNGGNDFDGCYMRDGVIQRVIGRNTNSDWQAYRPVAVYINGQYHAMMAMRERSNEDNIAANYNELEDIDMFENWNELKAGDEAAAKEFEDFVYGDHDFEQWSQYIDVESFANLMVVNYWVYNADFPMNNVVMWRRTDGGDARWRWIVKDCDYGIGLWNEEDYLERDFNSFLYSNAGPYVGFDIWQRLMRTGFRGYFLDHLVAYMGDFMNARTFHSYIDEILAVAGDEIALSHSKWGSTWSDLNYNIDFMRSWIDRREAYMPKLMQESWGVGAPVKVRVNTTLPLDALAEAGIRYDDVPLTKGVFDGYDYAGRTLRLSGAEGRILGWEVTAGGNTHTYETPQLSLTLEEGADLDITAIIDPSGITSVDADKNPVRIVNGTVHARGLIEIFDLAGRKVSDGHNTLELPGKGMYIVKAAGRTVKSFN